MRRFLTAAIATAAVLAAGVGIGVGVADAATTTNSGETPVRMMIRSDTVQQSFTPASDTWVDVPGTDMSLQATDSNFMLARLGAQSRCEGASGWCSVRIMLASEVTGTFSEARPADGVNFVWQMAGSPWGTTMIERHVDAQLLPTNPVRFRNYNAKVQVALHGGATRFRIQDWTLAVEIVTSGFNR